MPFRHLERRTVSRKTPNDGKLEITRAAAARLGALPDALQVEVSGRTGAATLDRMACTCKGAEGAHEHFFLQSELFKGLAVDSEVDLSLDASCAVVVVRPRQEQ